MPHAGAGLAPFSFYPGDWTPACRRDIWSTGMWPGGNSASSHCSQTAPNTPPFLRRLLKNMGLRVGETLKMDVG